MKDVFDMKIGDTKLFYPQFCFDCQSANISATKLNPCPWCGSENIINHEGKIYKNEMQMREPCQSR